MNVYNGMPRGRLIEITKNIHNVSIGIYGDLCLDIYWLADMRLAELSRETPHFAMPVVEERISLGGGGNVAANAAALKPKKVYAAGTAGTDWRGGELLRLMNGHGIETEYIVSETGLVTNAFCKPLRRGVSELVYEDARLDFANVKPFGAEVENRLIESLNAMTKRIDVLCVCDQLPVTAKGVVTPKVRERITALAKNGLTVIVDSRDNVGLYSGVIVKPNEIEGARAVGTPSLSGIDGFAETASALSRKQNGEVIMTVGENGSVYANGGSVTHIPARTVTGETDTVGAGDAFLAGFALAAAANAERREAAFFAGLCGEVVIQKIGVTGTASAKEVIARYDGVGQVN